MFIFIFIFKYYSKKFIDERKKLIDPSLILRTKEKKRYNRSQKKLWIALNFRYFQDKGDEIK